MTLAAGKLNQRITLQRRATGHDAAGQPVQTWADICTVWADVRYQGGLESLKGGEPVSVAKASIRIRYRTELDAGMRAVLGATVFDIKAVLPDAGREYLDLSCETGANQG